MTCRSTTPTFPARRRSLTPELVVDDAESPKSRVSSEGVVNGGVPAAGEDDRNVSEQPPQELRASPDITESYLKRLPTGRENQNNRAAEQRETAVVGVAREDHEARASLAILRAQVVTSSQTAPKSEAGALKVCMNARAKDQEMKSSERLARWTQIQKGNSDLTSSVRGVLWAPSPHSIGARSVGVCPNTISCGFS